MTETSPVTMSVASTAAYLSEALGSRPENWLSWLANDRRPNRVKRFLRVEQGSGRPRYAKTSVDEYIASVRSQGVEKDKTAKELLPRKARRFVVSIAALKEEDGADVPGVAFFCAKPLMAYTLSAAEARNIARRLNLSADEIDPLPVK